MEKRIYSIISALTFISLFLPLCVFGYAVQNLGFTGPGEGDFVLGPGKTELLMEPGETAVKEIYVTNRIGKTMDFKIEIEDFKGSRDIENTVVLLGDKKGPYSLKDYIHPEIDSFTLDYGQRLTFKVEISVPQDAQPGGLYGAVIISTDPKPDESDKGAAGVKIISRLGSLFFVRVKGDAEEVGVLKGFSANKNFYEKGPISLQVLFENNGSVYLAPYGIIEIRNILGKKIDEIVLDPWFSMPDSLRSRIVEWKRDLLFGRYTATVRVNRGYGDIIDERSVQFWVLPWKILLIVFAVLVLFILSIVWIFSHFEIKKKNKNVV
ncbi:MAG: hypothetical protein PHI53_02280 [Candidatus Pacebacteria bacterium]|nr:hypothetical protein [Candidatus Paceibacterota bacterium]